MEQIEDDFSLRQFFLTALIYGSHISMTIASMALRCLTVNLLKNLSRIWPCALCDKDHAATQIVQDDSHVALTFSDGDLVYSQKAKPLVVELTIIALQIKLVDGFNRFPIQAQVSSHLGYGHILA